MLWYFGRHPEGKDEPAPETGKTQSPAEAKKAISRAVLIEQLIDVDNRQAGTQTQPDDFPESQQGTGLEREAKLADIEEELSFPESLDDCRDPDTNSSGTECLVQATDESKQASPALQALMDLPDEKEQEQDPNLRLLIDMIRNSRERPSWEHVRAENAKVKALWSQYANLKIRAGTLLRHHKNQGILDYWQIVAPQTIRTRIF